MLTILILFIIGNVFSASGGRIPSDKKTLRCKISNVLDSLTFKNNNKFIQMRGNIKQHQQSIEEESKLLTLFGGVSRKKLLHIMEVPEGFRVFRVKDGKFESKFIKSHREAKKYLNSIRDPLELGALSAKLGRELLSIKKHLGTLIGDENISQRIKDTYSVKRKIFRLIDETEGSFPIEKLKDLIGFRIVVNTKKDQVAMLEKLKLGLKDAIIEVKDIDKIGQTGYRALHIIAKSQQAQLYEIQIVTDMMKKWHAWDHKYVYKSIYPPGEYQDKLIEYSRSVAAHVRRLEDGKKSKMPDFKKFNILEKDAFREDINITNQ